MANPDNPHSREKALGCPSPEKEAGCSSSSDADHASTGHVEAEAEHQRVNQEETRACGPSRRRFSEVPRPCPTSAIACAPVPSIPPLLRRRRNRWDQPPCCPNGQAILMMTCCHANKCRECVVANPCGCQGRGFAVPKFPQYPIPNDCILERPITLEYPKWLRIYAGRTGDDVWLVYICLEDLVHQHQEVSICQVHRYETVGRFWTRFHCDIYQWRTKVCAFSYPPVSSQDVRDFQRVVEICRHLCRR